MTINGSFFPARAGIKVALSNGSGTTATTTNLGNFQVTLPAPSTAGNYTATASRADGGSANGLPKV
ncbi:MAG: hypothetical protein M3141_10440, partial [Actinomycetota bacterium]|nr:hypothetical protein [Actinomycetota bacterium]